MGIFHELRPFLSDLLGGHYSLVNNVRGNILLGDTVHYDTGSDLQ